MNTWETWPCLPYEWDRYPLPITFDTLGFHPPNAIAVNRHVSDWPLRVAHFLKEHDYEFPQTQNSTSSWLMLHS